MSERLTMEHLLFCSPQRPDAVLPAMEGTRHEEEMTVAQFMEDIVLSSRPWIKQPDNKGGLASKLSALGEHTCLSLFASLHQLLAWRRSRHLSSTTLMCKPPSLFKTLLAALNFDRISLDF
jgi:hypothetical protein